MDTPAIEKFTNVLVEWYRYLAPLRFDPLPVTSHQAMCAMGVLKVVAALFVPTHPMLGALVAAASLGGIVVNLLLFPAYFDVAVRDLGRLLAGVALRPLSTRFDPRPVLWPARRI